MHAAALLLFFFFFFNDTATTEIYTLSLHDALPISPVPSPTTPSTVWWRRPMQRPARTRARWRDRKSTRLNSSHTVISYAVFCLKKKKIRRKEPHDERPVARTRRASTLASGLQQFLD